MAAEAKVVERELRRASGGPPAGRDLPVRRQRGRVLRRTLAGDPGQVYYLYLPTTGDLVNARVLVSVHGISRNAEEHAERFAPLAEREGVIVVAPLFTERRFPGFQRLAASGRRRPERVLEAIVAEVGALTGAFTGRLWMFGFSGGGQFVHRYALTAPHRVAAYAAGAAGWYTFPDANVRYPYGLATDAPADGKRGRHFDPDAFLQVPASVLVGEWDGERDPSLKTSARLDRQQGHDRIERGRRWVDAMERAARGRGLSTTFRFRLLEGSGHSFTESMCFSGLGEQVFACLFAIAEPAVAD